MKEKDAIRRPELLAPAGDYERLEAALLYGADAVYMGGTSFGMRAASANFDPEQLEQAVKLCHAQGVKAYLTCNTIPTNPDLEHLPNFIRHGAEIGIDGLIVADIGVLMLAKRLAPGLPIHISTQAGVVNHLAAAEYFHLGAGRVILARELSLEQIRRIRENTPPELELEAFVHGAMCMSFSGRCLLSHYMTGRDANRGECAQPCRWSYRLVEEKRPGEYYPIIEEDGGSYILNAHDLCMIGYLDKLAEAGVTSMKIEGRAKSAYYVACVTNAYRMALDLYKKAPKRFRLPQWLGEEVAKASHRPMTTGFYLGDSPGQRIASGGYIRDWEVVAVVDGWHDGHLYCTEKNRITVGDKLEVLIPGRRPEEIRVSALYDQEGKAIDVARHPHMRISIPWDAGYPKGSFLRRKKEQ